MKKINESSMTEILQPSNPTFSPDGTKLVFDVFELSEKDDCYCKQLFLNREGRQTRLHCAGNYSCRRWLDNETLIYCVNDENACDVYRLDVSMDASAHVARLDMSASDVIPMSSGDLVFVCRYDNQGKRNTGWSVATELPIWENGRHGLISGYRTRLYRFRMSDGCFYPISEPDMQVEEYSCRGNTVVWAGCAYSDVYDPRKGVYSYSGETGAVTCLVKPGRFYITGLDILNDRVMLLAYAGEHNDPWHPKDVYSVGAGDDAPHMLLDWKVISPGCTIITDSKFGSGCNCRSEGEWFYFVSAERRSSSVFRVNCEGKCERVCEGMCADLFDVNKDNVCVRSLAWDRGPELFLNGVQITDCSWRFTKEHTISEPKLHTFINRDGIEIDGWVMKPVDYDPSLTYPGILSIHGGPRMQFSEVLHQEHQVLAAEGYFVFYCNPRGSEGRGMEYGELYGRYGTVDYDDLMDFTDDVLASFPQIDAQRLGVTGGSYGGFMTNWIIGHSTRFNAAVSDRSISNMGLSEVASDIGFYWEEVEMGVSIYDDPGKIWEGSPLKYAGRVVTPTLFMQSDEDYRCLYIDAVSMFTVLKRNGVDSRLCLFHGESHDLSRSGKISNRIHRLRETTDWFNGYLKPIPAE